MKTSCVLIIFMVMLIFPVSVQGQDSTAHPRSLLFSPGSGMRSGAENLSTIHYHFGMVEDRLLGTSWVPEDNLYGKLINVAGRTAKFAFLDMPVDYFTIVFMHEWYGHGSRYRELDVTNVDYGYGWPPPYGEGDGWASYYSSPGEYSTQERIGIWIGGLESEQVLNRIMRQRWMISGEQHYREGWFYFWSFQNIMAYIQDAIDLVPGQDSFNDPQAYVFYLNQDNGYDSIDDYPFSLPDLKQVKNRSVLDPFIWFSIYNNFISYLWGGEPVGKIPRLHFANIDYLPAVHLALTPFGVETNLENYLIINDDFYMLNFRFGEPTYYQSWGGLGFLASDLFTHSNFSSDLKIDLWKQPALKLGGSEVETGGGIGYAFSLRTYYKLTNVSVPMKTIMEIGYKTAGFLEGYPLDSALILMVGVQI